MSAFRGWLREQRKRRDPVGDLSRDMIADGRCWTGRTPQSLRQHMEDEHGAFDSALAALERAWHEWLLPNIHQHASFAERDACAYCGPVVRSARFRRAIDTDTWSHEARAARTGKV